MPLNAAAPYSRFMPKLLALKNQKSRQKSAVAGFKVVFMMRQLPVNLCQNDIKLTLMKHGLELKHLALPIVTGAPLEQILLGLASDSKRGSAQVTLILKKLQVIPLNGHDM